MTHDAPHDAPHDAARDAETAADDSHADAPGDAPGDAPNGRFGDPLGDEIAELCAHLDAGTYRLLTLLRAFDAQELWSGWKSCAQWLSWRTGLSAGPARERVRVARRLGELPVVAAEMERGRLSWSKVRALTRVATPQSETRLVDFALRHTANQIERFVRAQRSAEAALAPPDGEAEMAARRHLSIRVEDDGMYRIRGRLLPEVGALLTRALDKAADEIYRQERLAERESERAAERASKRAAEADADDATEAETRTEADARTEADFDPAADSAADPAAESAVDGELAWEPAPLRLPRTSGERSHDALAAWLEEETEAEVQLVVHAVAGNADLVATEDGSCVPAGTSARLCCDAEAVRVERGADGSVLDVGRRRRTVDRRLRTALEVRDGGCRFPGCGYRRHTHAHHAVPWSEGGETSLDNLILLCRFHHRTVHEGGWRVVMGLGGAAWFRDPWEGVVPAVPPARDDVKPPRGADAGLGRWHRRVGINPWTAAHQWEGDRLDLDWALWVLWGQYVHSPDPDAASRAAA